MIIRGLVIIALFGWRDERRRPPAFAAQPDAGA